MTIITESLISECQSQRTTCLNSTLNKAYTKSLYDANQLGIDFNLKNKDIKKIIIHNTIIELCELKKTTRRDTVFFIDRLKYSEDHLLIIDEIVSKMELYKQEKSNNFLSNFKKYLKKNGFNYIINVYLKQVTNKLALFK
jgi:hypothetical protein